MSSGRPYYGAVTHVFLEMPLANCSSVRSTSSIGSRLALLLPAQLWFLTFVPREFFQHFVGYLDNPQRIEGASLAVEEDRS